MPADAAAKELLDGLTHGTLDDDAQRMLLGKAGIPERLPAAPGRAGRSRGRRPVQALFRDEHRRSGSATSSRPASSRNTCSSR